MLFRSKLFREKPTARKPYRTTPFGERRRQTPTARNPLPAPLRPRPPVPDGGRPSARAAEGARPGQPHPVRGIRVHCSRQWTRTEPLRGSLKPEGRLQAHFCQAGRLGVPGGRGAQRAGARRGRSPNRAKGADVGVCRGSGAGTGPRGRVVLKLRGGCPELRLPRRRSALSSGPASWSRTLRRCQPRTLALPGAGPPSAPPRSAAYGLQQNLQKLRHLAGKRGQTRMPPGCSDLEIGRASCRERV